MAIVLLIIATSVGLCFLARPALRLDYYFDEAWRADMIGSHWTFALYRRHDTPIPPGWLMSMWTIFSVVPTRRPLVRAVNCLPYVIAVVFMFDAARLLLRKRYDERTSIVLAFTSVAPILATPAMAQLATYLNNYFTDIALAAILVWAVLRWQRDRVWWALAAVAVVAAVGPWLGQGVLLMIPGALAMLWIDVRRTKQPDAQGRLLAIGAIFLGSAAASYLLFLRTVQPTVASFWANDSVAGLGPIALVRRWLSSFVDQTLPRAFTHNRLATAVLVVMTLAGLTFLWRHGRSVLGIVASAEVLAVALSYAKGWPYTFVRLNVPFLWIIIMAFWLGLALTVHGVLSVVFRQSLQGQRIGLAVAMLAITWVCRPTDVVRAAAGTAVFARGLTDDLEVIANGAKPGDAVATYHPLSVWYAHNRLLNDPAPPIVLLDELRYGPRLSTDLASIIDQQAPTATHAWCVVPFELGGPASTAACQLPTDTWTLTSSQVLTRSEIRLWTKKPPTA